MENGKMQKENKGEMEYVIQVDHRYVDKIGDLLKSLELSHVKVVPEKKKES